MVRADTVRLRQVFINLLSNAIKFSDAGAEIQLGAQRDHSGALLITVRDNGRGIAPNDLERVMEPFNQGQAMISDGSGTGLGLPLTRAMAELHGGRLQIQSTLGKGTIVTIVLPGERLLGAAQQLGGKSKRA